MQNVADRKSLFQNPFAAAAVSQLPEQIKNVSGKAGKDFAPDQTDYTIYMDTATPHLTANLPPPSC